MDIDQNQDDEEYAILSNMSWEIEDLHMRTISSINGDTFWNRLGK